METTRSKWIPRLFMAAMVPSIAMIVAMLMYPESEISKCPWLLQTAGIERNVNPEWPFFQINGTRFHVNNTKVSLSQIGVEPVVVLLGSVFDVRSAEAYYGPEGGYHALASGADATKMLVTSNLTLDDTDLSGIAKGKLKEGLIQWIPFYWNKYPQLGVVEGLYFDSNGRPTELWNEIRQLVFSDSRGDRGSDPSLVDCEVSSAVYCKDDRRVPKIIRRLGRSECACVIENEIFARKSTDFVIVHFANCEEQDKICHPKQSELD